MTSKIPDNVISTDITIETLDVTGNLNTSNLVCETMSTDSITGLILPNYSGTINKTIHINSTVVLHLPSITNSFTQAGARYTDVTFFDHGYPGKTVTWTGFIFGKDSDASFTTGEIRVYKTPSGGSESLTITQAFSGLASADTVYQAFSSSFTTVSGDYLRFTGRRTDGSDGSECVFVLYGEISI